MSGLLEGSAAAAAPPLRATDPVASAAGALSPSMAAGQQRQEPKNSWAGRVWLSISTALEPFFFARHAEHSDDHLVEVVRRDPVAASKLITYVALFSALGNTVVGLSCGLFLGRYWDRCNDCDRPLRWWLLIQAMLQVSQLPVRLVLLFSIWRTEAAGSSVEACMTSLTASPAWRASKTVALMQYGWFVLGMVWWMHTEPCPKCPGISKLTASVMILSAARAVVALAIFRLLFDPRGNGEDGEAAPKVMAASASMIASLPVLRYSPSACDDPNATCSICLMEYTDGVSMRRLPCGHDFHKRCVDRWLQRNKRCPLCVHPIDEPCAKPRAQLAAPSSDAPLACAAAADEQSAGR